MMSVEAQNAEHAQRAEKRCRYDGESWKGCTGL